MSSAKSQSIAAGGDSNAKALTVDDDDRDSLHTLPLLILPLKHPGLRSARLIKNARLESVIELFSGDDTGSGQVTIDAIPQAYGWPADAPFVDRPLLQRLALLPSYDAYSLRITLREQGIPVDEQEYLRLSNKKLEKLTAYMRVFTDPLILRVYGSQDVQIESYSELIALFRGSDVQQARRNLQLMADMLNIRIDAVPQFLEDYADIFMSLSYYKDCMEAVRPQIDDFCSALDLIRSNRMLMADHSLRRACDKIEQAVLQMIDSLTERFEDFDVETRNMWDEISAESFHRVETLIEGYHVGIGAILCALTVKMAAWSRHFSIPGTASPIKAAEVVRSEMQHGLTNLRSFVTPLRTTSKYAKQV